MAELETNPPARSRKCWGLTHYASQLEALGRARTAKSCLYIKRLADVDQDVLREIIEDSVRRMRAAESSPDVAAG